MNFLLILPSFAWCIKNELSKNTQLTAPSMSKFPPCTLLRCNLFPFTKERNVNISLFWVKNQNFFLWCVVLKIILSFTSVLNCIILTLAIEVSQLSILRQGIRKRITFVHVTIFLYFRHFFASQKNFFAASLLAISFLDLSRDLLGNDEFNFFCVLSECML